MWNDYILCIVTWLKCIPVSYVCNQSIDICYVYLYVIVWEGAPPKLVEPHSCPCPATPLLPRESLSCDPGGGLSLVDMPWRRALYVWMWPREAWVVRFYQLLEGEALPKPMCQPWVAWILTINGRPKETIGEYIIQLKCTLLELML